MSRLSDLYKAMGTLRKEGLPVNEDLEKKANNLEEDLIRQEILPTLTDKIEPALTQVKRELVLVVDYVPGEPLKVSLSRKRNISDVLTDAVEISPKRPHVVTATNITRSAYIDFKVMFADGFTCEGNGKDTFIQALRHMSLPRVSTFNGRIFAGFPVVGKKQRITEDGYKWQEKVEDWWIYVNMSNTTKIDMIRNIADFLGIDVSIEVYNQHEKGTEDKLNGKRSLFSLNDGTPMNKRSSVLATVKKYVVENPQATFTQIQEAFPGYLQGSYGVVKPVAEIRQRMDRGQDAEHRYYMEPKNIMTSRDGIKFAVCNQWGHQFHVFQSHVKKTLGWDIIEV